MRLGKLDNDTLQQLVLDKFSHTRPESLCSPEIGLDCATLDLGGDLAVLSCDPITSAGLAQLGRLTVNVSCNDAAAAGAEPVGLLVTLLAPPQASETEIGRIADDIAAAAKNAGVDILGGHTEVTDAVARYVTCATIIARMPRGMELCGMQEGDEIVMTKYAGLEGTAILLSDHADRLAAVPPIPFDLDAALSVVPESRIAVLHGAHAMHDVTEGGVLGALWEMGRLYGCGLYVDTARIPVLNATREICAVLSLEPLRLIGSGSMLIACRDASSLCAKLKAAGIPAVCIGRAVGAGVRDQNDCLIEPPEADEIYSLS